MSSKRALPLLVAVLCGSAWAASDTDVAWIGDLPGLTLQTSKTTAGDGFKAVYTTSAGADATMGNVRAGLSERGWTIRKAVDAPAGSIQVLTLVAEKDAASVKVAVTSALGIGTLTLTLRGGAPERASSRARSDGTAVAGGSALVVTGDAVTDMHDCMDRDVTVSANRSGITLRGACQTVTVVGDSNTVTVDGTVRAIQAVGRANTVVWSAAKNAQPPVVKHVGRQNRVHSDAQR